MGVADRLRKGTIRGLNPKHAIAIFLLLGE